MNHLYKFQLLNQTIHLEHQYVSGDVYGDGYLSPDGKYFYLQIPKNLSSTLKSIVEANNWHATNISQITKNAQVFTVLRDPTQRWISGVTEYFLGHSKLGEFTREFNSISDVENLLNNSIFQTMLFDCIFFDSHTLPQAWFCQGLSLDTTHFFLQTDSVLEMVCEKMHLKCNNTSLRSNSHKSSALKVVFLKKVRELLNTTPRYQKLLDTNYWCDHQLLDSVKFC